MKRKKIALLDAIGSNSGMDYYDMSLLNALEETGFEGFLYSNFQWKENPKNSFPFFPASGVPAVSRMILYPLRYIQALNHAKKSGCTSVIFHVFHFNRLDEWILGKIKNLGMQILLIVHDVESFVRATNISRLRRVCEQLADALIVHNQFTKAELYRIISAEAGKKIKIIPHGNFLSLSTSGPSKAEARERLGMEKGKTFVLFFGMIKPNKGLDILLKAWKTVQSEASLVIAGRMRKLSFEAFNQIIEEELKSADIRMLIRSITNEERDLLFRAADIVVLPYTRIYQSAVLLLAMSYGIPVIASRLEPFEEVIKHQENGFLVEPRNPSELANAIIKLSTDVELRSHFVKNALETMDIHHNWKMIARQFAPLIS